MRNSSLLLIGVLLAGCETAPPPGPTPEAQLRQELAGRVAGEASSCLPTMRSGGFQSFGGNAVLFRDGTKIWVSQAEGEGCDQLDGVNYTLVTRTTSARLCSGDIGRVVDLTSGIEAGSCVMGPFVPYSRP